MHTNDWKGTLESCKKVLEHDPEHIGALEVAAQALWFEGKYSDVVKTTSRLLMLNPDEPGYRYTRGMALMSMGKLSQASEDFRQALRQSKDQRFVAQVRNALIVIEEFQSGWVGHRQRLKAIKLARQFSDPGYEPDVSIH